MDPETLLASTIAQALHDADLGVYAPDAETYEPGVHAIYTNRVLPASGMCTLVTTSPPVPDGRADMLYRAQILTRLPPNGIRPRATAIFDLFDSRAYFPQILGISWASEYSRLYFDPDTQGRAMVAQNVQFRGRR